jgi:hypothetical protein
LNCNALLSEERVLPLSEFGRERWPQALEPARVLVSLFRQAEVICTFNFHLFFALFFHRKNTFKRIGNRLQGRGDRSEALGHGPEALARTREFWSTRTSFVVSGDCGTACERSIRRASVPTCDER